MKCLKLSHFTAAVSALLCCLAAAWSFTCSAASDVQVLTDVPSALAYSVIDRLVDDFEDRTAGFFAYNMLAALDGAAYHGRQSLCLTVESPDDPSSVSSMLGKSFVPALNLTDERYLVFSVWLPEGTTGQILIVELDNATVPTEVQKYSTSAVLGEGGGWQTVCCDISGFGGRDALTDLTLTLVSSGRLPARWYLDCVGFSSVQNAGRILRYSSAECYAGNGRLVQDASSMRLFAASDDPFLDFRSLDPDIYSDGSRMELCFSSTSPIDGVRVYWTTAWSAGGAFTDSLFLPAVSDGRYAVLTFEIPQAADIRLSFEGIGSGIVTVYSFRPRPGLEAESAIAGVSSCQLIADDRFRVTGTLPADFAAQAKNLRIGLFAAENAAETLATARVSENFSLECPLYDGESSRLNTGFSLAILLENGNKVALTSRPFYITNPDLLQEGAVWSYPDVRVKKGLTGSALDCAAAVSEGVRNTVVRVDLTALLSDPGSGTEFSHDGRVLYLNEQAVAALDSRLSSLWAVGINIRLLLGCDDPDSILYADTACPYAVRSEEGRQTLAALASFLAQRYSAGSDENGRVIAYLLAPPREYSGAGTAFYDTADMAYDYAAALRIVYNSVRSAGNAAVLVTLNNGWESTRTSAPNNRAFLELLADATNAGGAFGWGLCYAPYPAQTAVYASWKDEGAVADWRCERITTANLSLLVSFMKRASMTYADECRRIVLFDLTDAPPLTQDEASEAAAEFILAYYKVNTRAYAEIECFIFNCVTAYDHVFRDIDTGHTDEYSAFALGTIGANEWRELFEGWDETRIVRRTQVFSEWQPAAAQGAAYSLTGNGAVVRYAGWDGVAALAASGEARMPDDAAVMVRLSEIAGSRMFGASFAYPLDLTEAPVLSFDVQIASLPQDVSEVSLRIVLFSGDHTFIADGILSSGGRQTVTVDTAGFATTGRRIDRIRFLVSGTGGAEIGSPTLYFSPLSAYSDTLSPSELESYFNTQRDTHASSGFSFPHLFEILILTGIIALCLVLFLIRRILPERRADDEEDFTDMRIWKS